MYTRNRPNPGYNNPRNQNNQNPGFQGPNAYNQQGIFVSSQPSPSQQANYKPGNAQNLQGFVPQSQQAQMQQAAMARNMQQSSAQVTQSPQQQQLLQQQRMQQEQQGKQQPLSTPQPRLKPILKQPSQPQASPPIQISVPTTLAPTPNPSAAASAAVTTQIPAVPASAPATVPSNIADSKNDNQSTDSIDAEVQELPRWRRKILGLNNIVNAAKVNKRMKRIRLNQRLRKTLQPKNAIMVLNEMKAGVQFTFPETQGPMPNSLYLVHAELDGKTYVGQGLSKPLARQNAAENALKALLLEKMTAATAKARIDAEIDRQGTQLNRPAQAFTPQAKNDKQDESIAMETNVDEPDEIPWSSLASFALYKLFLEWHHQGTSVPVPRPGVPSPVKGIKKEPPIPPKPPVQKELPPNATGIHPVMLLNQMKPGLAYAEQNRVGHPPNTMFTLAVEIDGVEYSGTAKNKKDAKKAAAKSALLALYGLNYPDESKSQEQSDEVQMA